MRIAINGLFLREPHSGTGQYLLNLLRELERGAGNDEFILVAPEDVSKPPFLRRIAFHAYSDAGRRLGANLGKVWFEQVVFPRACLAQRADLAHVPHWGSPLRPPVPTVVTIHDLIPLLLPAYRGSLAVRQYTRLVSAGARRAAHILADSDCSARDIVQRLHVPAERVSAIYLAVEARYAPQPPEAISAARARWNLPPRFLLYLGGYDIRKNLALLMEALAELHDPAIPLICAGAPPPESAFFPHPLRLARAAGVESQVRLLGRIEEESKPGLLGAAWAFLFPSRYEGFGLPPLEAMACGTPALVGQGGSLPEVVGEAGGLLPGDAHAWAAALRRIWDDESWRAALAEKGLVQAARFSWERTVEQTREVYRRVVRGQTRR